MREGVAQVEAGDRASAGMVWRCLPGRRALWLWCVGAVPLLGVTLWREVLVLVLVWNCAVLLGLLRGCSQDLHDARREVSRDFAFGVVPPAVLLPQA